MTLSWTAPTDTAYSDYYYQHKLRSEGSYGPATHTTMTSAAVGGLTSGMEYDFRVRACQSASNTNSNCGAWKTARATAVSAPARVTDLSVTVSGNAATLSWTVPSDGGSAFTKLQVSVDNGSGFSVPSGGVTDNPAHTAGTTQTLTTSAIYDSLTKFRILYGNAIGDAAYSNVAMAGPGAPVLTGTPSGDANDILTWTAPADEGGSAITDYQHRVRAIASPQPAWGAWSTLAASTALTRTITKPGHFTGYEYQVRAVNSSGAGAESNSVSIAGRPGSPTALAASQVTGSVAIDVTWTAPTNIGGGPLTGYSVQWREHVVGNWSDNGADGTRNLAGDATSVRISSPDLDPDTNYNFRISATTNGNRRSYWHPGDESVAAMTIDVQTAPAKPVLTVTAGTGAQVVLSWTTPNDGGSAITKYQRRDAPSSAAQLDTWNLPEDVAESLNTLTYALSGALIQPYSFQVRAVNAIGDGEWSDAVELAAEPGKPTALMGSAHSPTVDRLTWTAPNDANDGKDIDDYERRRREIGQSNWETEVATGSTMTSDDVTKTNQETGYEHAVRALNPDRTGPWSDSVSIAGRPGTVSDLAATASTTTVAVTLSWTAPSNGGKALSEYRVEWRVDAAGDWNADPALGHTTTSGSATSFTVSQGLQPNAVYDFRIRADNPDRVSFYSNTAQADQATLDVGATISATNPATLKEGNLDGATLTVDLAGTTFDSSIAVSEFSITPAVPGLSVSSVNRADNDTATLTLAYAWTDASMTADTNIAVVVDADAHAGTGNLTTGTVSVGHFTTSTVSYSEAVNYDVNESDDANPTLTLTEPVPLDVPVTVFLLPRGASSSDFVSPFGPGVESGDVVIPAGETSQTFTVQIVEDSIDESNEDIGTQTVLSSDLPAALTGKVSVDSFANPTITIIDNESPPGAPSGLTATLDGDDVDLSWTAPSDRGMVNGAAAAITGYEYRTALTSSDLGTAAWNDAGTGTTHSVTVAGAGTHHFQVRALNSADNAPGPASNEASATVVAPPDAPTGVGVTAGTGDGFTLSWTAPSGTVDSYTWEHREAGSSGAWTQGGTGVTGTSVTATVSGLAAIAREFRVYGVNSAGDGTPSAAVALAAAPGAVQNLTAEGYRRVPGNSAGTMRLKWAAPVVDGIDNGDDDITGYDYERRTGGAMFADRASTTGTQVDISPLSENSAWDFQVRAKNADRAGPWTMLAVSRVPAASTSVTATASTTSTDVTVTWNAVTADTPIVEYLVQYNETPSGTANWMDGPVVRAPAPGQAPPTTATVPGLAASTDYRFRVRADTAHRYGWWSGEDTARTAAVGASVTAPNPATLNEADLNGATLTVTLAGTNYETSIAASQFTLTPAVAGLRVSNASRTSATEAVLTLAFTGDLTADTDLQIGVTDAAHTGTGTLTTAAVRLVAARTVTLTVAPNPVDEGASATVTATMTPAPSADVTLRVSIAAPEGSANPLENGDLEQTGSMLTIAAGDTASTGSVTLQAFQDDDADDEEVAVRATVTGGHSAPDDVTLVIDDDDDPGVTVTADDPIMVDEGSSATYTVVLDTQPSADVRVTVSRASGSSDVTWDADDQADGDQNFVTFTSSNWNTARTVTVRALEDADQVNDNAVLRHVASSSDSSYNRVAVANGTVNVTVDDDDDVPGVQLGVLRPSPVPEGGTARYMVRLNTQPSEDVTVTVSSDNADVTFDADDRTDGDQASVTFTSSNWNASRTVTVRAATDPDAASDEAMLTHTASSADTEYQGVSDVLTVPVAEAETAAITLGALSVSPVEENGTATYTVVLDAEPTSSVVIDITSDNRDVTVEPAPLTFTSANWDTARTVTVSAADDGDSLDETATLTHAVRNADSADEYDGLSSTLEVPVRDDDVPGLTLSRTALTVGEGASATYEVLLQVEPSADVVVAVTGGSRDVSAFPRRLTFTAENWDTAQTVTVAAAEDNDTLDDKVTLTHRVVDGESAAEYRGVASRLLAVTVDDNDAEASRSIRIAPLRVNEGDGTVDVEVVIDLGEQFSQYYAVWAEGGHSLGEALPRELYPDDWDFSGGYKTEDEGPSIRFTTGPDGVLTHRLQLVLNDDTEQESDERVLIRYSMATIPHGQLTFNETLHATLIIVDNDGLAGVQASAAAVTVPGDSSTTYTLQLNAQPASAVTVAVESDNVEVTVSPASLRFTANDWSTPQTVKVSASTDSDGYEDRAVLTHTVTSSDGNYGGITVGDVVVTVPDTGTRDPGTGDPDTDDTGSTGNSGGGGGGGGGGAPAGNQAPETGEILAAATVVAGASLEIDLSEAFEDADDDDLAYEAESSDESVATVAVDDATLTLNGVAPGAARITVTATDPDDESVSQTFRVTVIAAGTAPTADGLGTKVWLFASADDPTRQGFARVLNHSDESGTATITATDDAGRTYEPLTLTLGPGQTAPFNSDDLESGNAAKGLAGGTGPGTGGWRFEVDSPTLDVEALGYLRTSDGFVTAMVATAPADEDGTRRVATFNPASNVNQVSLLRLVNPHDEEAQATVTGVDDAGRSPGRPVALTVPAGTGCTVDAAELESGRGLACGSPQAGLGDGAGKWRLAVESDPPLVAMSLLSSPTGHLTNLSGVASPAADGVWHAHLFPAASDPLGRQGFMRVRNRSDEAGTVTIAARDDTDREYETLTLALAAGQTRHFNSDDLELGNASKGLTGSTGSGTGTWRLALSSNDIEFEANAYIRTSEGFLTAMNASAPTAEGVHRVAIFNPGSNRNQVSILRLVNPGTRTAVATVAGTDDSGARPGTTVRVLVPAGDAVELTAAELESGDAAAITAGALGDGKGKWRLRIEANRDIVAMSLLSSPTGHLTNLSRADPTRVD